MDIALSLYESHKPKLGLATSLSIFVLTVLNIRSKSRNLLIEQASTVQIVRDPKLSAYLFAGRAFTNATILTLSGAGCLLSGTFIGLGATTVYAFHLDNVS